MSWEGVGPRLALAFAPFLALAVTMRVLAPGASRLAFIPPPLLQALGAVLLCAGIAFYLATAIHFFGRFARGELVTTGTYGLCRHPIYASFVVFFVPAAALLWNAWPLLIADVALYLAFRSFIHLEDGPLAERFGAAYERYRARVPELLPVPAALRRRRKRVPPSARVDAWLPGAPFADTIVVRSSAPPEAVMRAVEEVTLREMPLADRLGRARYAFGHAHPPMDAERPFVRALVAGRGSLVLERSAGELVVATVAKLHQIRDQEPADVRTPEEFLAFDAPNHEKLVMSVRALAGPGETLLCLEHRTRATDARAARRFALYWLAIRPGGAFVSRQLLLAVARRAERTSPRSPSTTTARHASA
jgi:protein-S-isoprenylcysteine O-methyltransferase Ste14